VALILEVLHGGRHPEVRDRRRLDGAPVTIGRALDNAVVLDDLHVDAQHARLEAQPDGSWAIVDLGSVNRIRVGRAAPTDRVVVTPGLSVTIGRTTLRFRDDSAPVPPAVPLPHADAESAPPAWFETPRARLGVIAASIVLFAVQAWMGATMRGIGSMVFGQLIAAMALAILWAGIWAIASRVVLGRFNFLAHAAIVALAVAVMSFVDELVGLLGFLLPSGDWSSAGEGFVLIALLAVLVALHLGAASHLAARVRWRTGALAAGIVLALLGISAALEEESFSPQAEFSGEIRTLSPALIPLQSVEEFAETRTELRAEVDALLQDAP
jgi:hypothetical protein